MNLNLKYLNLNIIMIMDPHSPYKITQNNHQNKKQINRVGKRTIQEQLCMLTQIYSAAQILPVLSFIKI